MNNFTLFFMCDVGWVALFALVYALYSMISKPKADKAIRLTVGFVFAYYMAFYVLSLATSVPTAKEIFWLALLPTAALWFAFAPYRKSKRVKIGALVVAAVYCVFFVAIVLLHGMSNM